MDTIMTLLLSFLLAFFVGMERQLSKKAVGFAPYMFVTVLSTTITLAAITYFPNSAAVIISGLITGIGFLGAGAVIKYQEKFFGFTTAAIIWTMAVFGVVIAFSDVVIISFAYIAIWTILIIDKIIEMEGLGRHMKTVIIEAKGASEHSDIKEIIMKYRDAKEEGVEMNFEKGIIEYRFLVPEHAKLDKMLTELSSVKSIERIHME